jgi:regulator of sigma E protease
MITVVSTIFVLGVLIFIHELGHFAVAKLLGIKVERFSLGFPPKLVGKRIGETEYCISWIPLGGYVRLAGDNPEEPLTGSPREFLSRPRWQRSLVIIAGPAMNYLFAIILVWSILTITGMGTFDAVIGEVEEGSPAQTMELKMGDRVTAVNGEVVSTWDDIYEHLPHSGGRVIFRIERDGEREDLTGQLPPASSERPDQLGISPLFTTEVGEVEKGGPADLAGITGGDVIEAVDGVPVDRWSEMVELIQAQPDTLISLRWRRGQQVHQATLRTRSMEVPDEDGEMTIRGYVGITSKVIQKSIGPAHSAIESLRWTFQTTGEIVSFIKGLLTGEVSARMVGGPIFIAQVAGQTARQGFSVLLYFMALLSVNLALINVLPIPILDGGQLCILLVEFVKGGSLTQRQRLIVQQIGLAIIVLLIIFVVFNDVDRLRNL